MNNKKIAVVCLSHFQGGMELDALKHTQMFNRNAINCLLICRTGTFLESLAQSQNVPFISIDFSKKLSLKLIQGLHNTIIDNQLSHLIFFGASEIKSIFFAVRSTNCKVIVRHGTTKSSPKKDFFHRLFYSCVSHYVAISEHLNKNVLDILPAKKEQIITIYPSLPSDTLAILTMEKRTDSFLFVGRVEKGKGIFDAVIALGKAQIPIGKKLTIVGQTTDDIKRDLLAQADKSGVILDFIGYTNDPTPYYRTHKYFLFPSHGEGFGNVILEALRYNLTCITYNNTVFPEFIKVGFSNFFLSENLNTDKLSESINGAYNQPDNQQNNNFKIIKNLFSEHAAMLKWKDILS